MSKRNKSTKLFVLDTNVMLHDPTCLFRFEEHDVFIPMVTLEELDAHKKGMSEVARNARQVSRFLDQLIHEAKHNITRGLPLKSMGASGRLFLQTQTINSALPITFPGNSNDNLILGITLALMEQNNGRSVILVSKDINMRIKACALGLEAEDYFNDQVLEDTDLLYTGQREIDQRFWERNAQNITSRQEQGRHYYQLQGPDIRSLFLNQLLWQADNPPLQAQVVELNDHQATLQTLKDYTHHKNSIWGITARNREQNFALNMLMDDQIDFVTLLGQAGTGKTLLTLAAGLSLTLEAKRYSEIIITRATVPLGEDIGFLPGTEEEKMAPWMGALDDNLDVLNKGGNDNGEWGRAATRDLIHSRIKVKSMSFMRGRTFLNKFVIIDEAQNLTPKQMKALITRAGPGTKMVCLGNIAQIDTPYLTEGSSGLTYVIDRFKGWKYSGHITLQRGERSRLAEHAGQIL